MSLSRLDAMLSNSKLSFLARKGRAKSLLTLGVEGSLARNIADVERVPEIADVERGFPLKFLVDASVRIS